MRFQNIIAKVVETEIFVICTETKRYSKETFGDEAVLGVYYEHVAIFAIF